MEVLIKIVNDNKLETGVYRTPTSTDIYINWNTHASTEWKIETLEMKYLAKVFHEVNNYPMSIINKTAPQELHDSESKSRRAEPNETPNTIEVILPYSGKQGNKSITKIKKHIWKTLPESIQTIVIYQS